MLIFSRVSRYLLRRSTLILLGSAAFLTGVIAAPWLSISGNLVVVFLLILGLSKRLKVLFVLAVCGFLFLLGNLRGVSAVNSELPVKSLFGEKVTFRAVVAEDSYYDAKKRITFTVTTQKFYEPKQINVKASIRINTYAVTSATKGEVVLIRGKLYPTLGNVAGAIYYAEVEPEFISNSSLADKSRREFNAGLQNALPEPAASFASGLLVGQRSGISEAWQDILRKAGLTHIIAVSGYNLTILVRFAKRIFRKRSRYQVLLVSGLLVGSFLMVTGFSPSIMRATIVVTLSLLSWYFGRKFLPLNLIIISAAISASIEPFQLWRSVGWYLSFAAFFGVIIIAPLLTPKRFLESDNAYVSLLAESLAAQIMTLPIIALVFGNVSLSGVVANILVVPFVPLAMLLSLIAGLAGWAIPHLSGWFGLPANWLLRSMLGIARWVSEFPATEIHAKITASAVCAWYATIVIFIILIWRSRVRTGFNWKKIVE